MVKKYFKGTWRLTYLFLSQNRLKIILWIIGIVGVSLAAALAYPELYATENDIMGFAMLMENPAMSALIGSPYAVEDYNIGAVFASEMLLFTIIAISIMNILLTKNSSKRDEEEGRVEIIRALPVGKLAYLVAGLMMTFIVNLIVVLVLTGGLAIIGDTIFKWESSLLYSLIIGSTGFLFASITAINAQLANTTYGTTILSFGLLFIFYTIRVIGDVINDTISLLSPLGWSLSTEVFVNNNWLPIVVINGLSIILLTVAFILFTRRDMFDGYFPTRPGKSSASPLLKNAVGFVWSLERIKIIGWFIFIFVMCATFGAVLGELETYFLDMELIENILAANAGEGITEQFISLLIQIMTIFSLIPGVMIIYSLKREETQGRAEHFYTRTVSRSKMMSVYFLVGFLTMIIMQLSIAFGLFSTSSYFLEESISLQTLLKSTLVYTPVLILILGFANGIVGFIPRGTLLTWIYIIFMFIVLYLGALLEFPEWVINLSALEIIPEYPHETFEWQPLIVTSIIGLVLTTIGFIGYNRRDIKS